MELDTIASTVWTWTREQLPTVAVTIAVTGSAMRLAFKTYGEKWLDRKFNLQLKKAQAELDAHLKGVQAQFDGSLKHVQWDLDQNIHRAKKLYDKEFDVMQEAWERATRCLDQGIQTAVDFYPPLSMLSEIELDGFLNRDEILTDGEKQELRTLKKEERTERYRFIANVQRLTKFSKELNEFRIFVLINSMYMRSEFEPKLTMIEHLVSDTLTDFEERLHGGAKTFKSVGTLGTVGRPLLAEIKNLIRIRLWSSASLSLDERIDDQIRSVAAPPSGQ